MMSGVGSFDKPARFITTKWTHILQARDTEGSLQAFSDLVHTYWYPIYAFARRTGHAHHDAQDLTQAFWTHLMANNSLRNVAPEIGRFRNFLIASFRNFLSNSHRASSAQRRGGDTQIFSMDAAFETRYACEPVDNETPESLFHRSCVEALLERVLRRLEQDYVRANKIRLFQLLEPYLTHRGDALPRADIAEELNISLPAVAMSIYRMRSRYSQLLHEEVAATVDNPDEVEDELKSLLSILVSH